MLFINKNQEKPHNLLGKSKGRDKKERQQEF